MPNSARDAQRTQPVVLVVDDDDDQRAVLEALLRTQGLLVETASNGREALAKLEALKPSLVLLDLLMPEMTGWDFLRELRGGRARSNIVVLSAAHHEAPAGYRYLHKPVDPDELFALVRQCCPSDVDPG